MAIEMFTPPFPRSWSVGFGSDRILTKMERAADQVGTLTFRAGVVADQALESLNAGLPIVVPQGYDAMAVAQAVLDHLGLSLAQRFDAGTRTQAQHLGKELIYEQILAPVAKLHPEALAQKAVVQTYDQPELIHQAVLKVEAARRLVAEYHLTLRSLPAAQKPEGSTLDPKLLGMIDLAWTALVNAATEKSEGILQANQALVDELKELKAGGFPAALADKAITIVDAQSARVGVAASTRRGSVPAVKDNYVLHGAIRHLIEGTPLPS